MKDLDSLHQEAIYSVKNFQASESELLRVLEKVEAEKVYVHRGFSSLFLYIVSDLGLSEAQAYAFSAVLKKSRQVPELKNEVSEGRLSIFKAQRIVSVLTPENKDIWIEKAKTLTKNEIEREVARVDPQFFRRKEIVRPIDEESLSLTLKIQRKNFESLRRTQNLLMSQRHQNLNLEETLVILLEDFLSRKDPMEKAKRNMNKRENKAVSQTHSSQPMAAIQNQVTKIPSNTSTPLHAPLLRRRFIPAQIRHRILVESKGGCSFIAANGKKCTSKTGLQIHHCQPWAQGGGHEVENLRLLCKAHHQWKHSEFGPHRPGGPPFQLLRQPGGGGPSKALSPP